MRTFPAKWLLVLGLMTLAAPNAYAWDSICSTYKDPTAKVSQLERTGRNCEGVAATRGRWRDPEENLDEHRGLLQVAIQRAGLPQKALETVVLQVFTNGSSVNAGGKPALTLPTFRPQRLDSPNIAARQSRAFAIDELAQLPDFSWSLADWASGNETCPIPELADEEDDVSTPVACHDFGTHMGALNASHFPPQSDRWFAYMHQLALERANQCRTMRKEAFERAATSLNKGCIYYDPSDPTSGTKYASWVDKRWGSFWRECEAEALALEAVAQHYLQDSWSSGHMWERWGSSDLSRFPAPLSTNILRYEWNQKSPDVRRLLIAEIVALHAGIIHGSDPVSYEKLGRTPLLGDALCYPESADDSALTVTGTDPIPVAGDMHIHDVLGDALTQEVFGVSREALHSKLSPPQLDPFTPPPGTPPTQLAQQAEGLLRCASGSVREVFDRLSDPGTYGEPAMGAATGAAPPPPSTECQAPRVRNATFARGFDLTLFTVEVAEQRAGLPIFIIPNDIEAQAAKDYFQASALSGLLAKAVPNGIDAASLHHREFRWKGSACTFDGSFCQDNGGDEFIELPGAVTMLGVEANSQYAPEPRTRPAAYADPPLPWGLASDPEQFLVSTFNRAHAPFWCKKFTQSMLDALIERVRTASPDTKDAICRACVEVVSRHVRLLYEDFSLCELWEPNSAVFEQPGEVCSSSAPTGFAKALCDCSPKPPPLPPF